MYDRWTEIMNDTPTDNSKIDWYPGCKGCIFADDTSDIGYRKAICEIYGLPNCKPWGLSDGREKCEYYESEE